VPDDPIFRLVFPQPEMLSAKDLSTVSEALSRDETTRVSLRQIAENIRSTLNAHPAGQKEENVPILNGCPVPGMQHKYKETVLFFPLEVRSLRAIYLKWLIILVGSILPYLLHLLFPLGTVYLRRILTTVQVK
jgi:hypothetical protein